MIKVTGAPRAEGEADFEESAQVYVELGVVKTYAEEGMKSRKEGLIESFKTSGEKVVKGEGWKLECRKSVKKAVDVEALDKICARKGVSVGGMHYVIRPKSAEKIPDEVLALLDQHFVLQIEREVSASDVQKAVDNGLLTDGDLAKCVSESESYALYPTASDAKKSSLVG